MLFRSIHSIGYDLQEQILEVEFLNGGVYQYSNVLENEYEQLMAASSKGRFIGSRIRDKYRTKKVR